MTSIETPSPPPGKANARHQLPPAHDEDLDDDDDNGSKAGDGDYEDVRCFDAESDLQPGGVVDKPIIPPQPPQQLVLPPQQHFHLPAAPIVVVAPPVHSSVGVSSTSSAVGGMAPMFIHQQQQQHQGGNGGATSSVLDFGGQDASELSLVSRIVSIPWPAAAGKRPPRDMKRLDINQWYVVCKVMKWGDTPALFMRVCNATDAETDFGFYKPPVLFHTYPFQVGDRLQLHMVGYSMSRNKIATSIRLRTTHMFPLTEGKLDWVVPPTPKNEPTTSTAAETSTKKKSNSASSNNSGSTHSSPRAPQASLHAQQQHQQMSEDLANKRKRLAIQLPVPQGLPQQQQQQTSPMHLVGGGGNNNSSLNFFHSSMGFPLASNAQQQPQQQQQQQMTHNNSLMYFPSNGSFSSNSNNNSNNANGNSSSQQQPNAPSYTVTASGFHMPGTPDMNRAPSFSFMNDLMASNPSAVNLIPPPSPNIMNSSAPSLMRIPPVSTSFPMSGSTPNANCPPAFSSSFGFGSTSNMSSFLAQQQQQQQQQQSTTPSMPSASLPAPISGGHLNNTLGE